ncbi:OsmC family protein [Streptomyces sp. NPDC057908]|uniref:OsmC family protein n=1 Tax=Streptomyces sp. NPDC057908 TaxID=3346276 RepID=UPI0036E311CA
MSVINDIDVQALRDTTAAVAADPKLGQATFSVNGSWQGGCRLTAQTGALTAGGERDEKRVAQFVMSSDEPVALLGTDTAVSPGEYLLQALAGCYTVTLAAHAAAQGIELKNFRLELEGDVDLRLPRRRPHHPPGPAAGTRPPPHRRPGHPARAARRPRRPRREPLAHPRHSRQPRRGRHHARLTVGIVRHPPTIPPARRLKGTRAGGIACRGVACLVEVVLEARTLGPGLVHQQAPSEGGQPLPPALPSRHAESAGAGFADPGWSRVKNFSQSASQEAVSVTLLECTRLLVLERLLA